MRMDAYYYGFVLTGVDAIDRILSAVACAGKAYHHTEDWGDKTSPYEGHRGDSPVDWIQNAANDAAAAWSTEKRKRASYVWMTAYISAIQRQLVEQYGLAPRADAPHIPANVPDGSYPMKIDGKLDHVKIENGMISCCNFESLKGTKTTS